jgi:hypothetical protein
MHPGDDPQIEAQSLYLEQSKLIEKLYSTQSNEDIVLWDVGMGAAFNTMAVINSVEAAFKQKKFQSKLKMYCFENDLNPLNLALCHPAHFTHLRHKAPHSLLEKNSYFNDFLECHLLEGDFLETMNHAPPDIEDVRAVAKAILRHRIVRNYKAEAEGVNIEAIIQQLL